MSGSVFERIKKRAYEIWEYRTQNNIGFEYRQPGTLYELTAQDDWLEAESEILGKDRG